MVMLFADAILCLHMSIPRVAPNEGLVAGATEVWTAALDAGGANARGQGETSDRYL